MLASLIAQRYSKALFGAARSSGSLEEVGGQAEALRTALAQTRAVSGPFLADPLAQPSAKLGVLGAAFPQGPHPILAAFLEAVLRQKRERYLPAMLAAFSGLLDGARGLVRVGIATARPLSADARRRWERALAPRLRATVALTPRTDRALLGGAVLTVGDVVYDASLKGGLRRLERLLAAGPAAVRRRPGGAVRAPAAAARRKAALPKKQAARAAAARKKPRA